MTRKILVFAALVLAITLVSLLVRWMFAGEEVTVVQAKRGQAVEAVYATGVVEPVYWSKLSAAEGGRITTILRDEGDIVKEGDVIARMDDREQTSDIESLQANLARLDNEMTRQRALIRKDVSSARQYESIKSQYEETKAALDAAGKRLFDMTFYAPMDGQVLRKTVEVGEYVKSGDPVFWVGRPLPLQIVAEVDEEDIPKVRVDQVALIKSDAYPGRVLEGKATKIIPKGDPVNKIFLVEVELPKDSGLLIGMTVEVNIVVAKHDNAILLPVTAVLANKVWVVEDGDAEERTIKTGIVSDKTAEILEGVKEGDLVIAPVPEGLESGDSVRVKRTDF